MPEPAVLKAIRQEIDYNLKDFEEIVGSKEFKAQFDGLDTGEGFKLSRPPKDYDASNPAIEHLKFKSFVATRHLSEKDLTSKDLLDKCEAAFKAIYPLNQFMDQVLAEV